MYLHVKFHQYDPVQYFVTSRFFTLTNYKKCTRPLADGPHFLAVSDCLLHRCTSYLKQVICCIHNMILRRAMDSKTQFFNEI
jgi:hypothetical protein